MPITVIAITFLFISVKYCAGIYFLLSLLDPILVGWCYEALLSNIYISRFNRMAYLPGNRLLLYARDLKLYLLSQN